MQFDELPRSWSADEVTESLGISRKQIQALIRDGKVGYIRVGRSRRFLARHVEQLIDAIEVQPQTVTDMLRRIGVTSTGAARRRRMQG